MNRFGVLCLAACLVAAGCGQDPAQSVKIAARPPEAAPPPSAAAMAAAAEPARPTDNIVHAPKGRVTPPATGAAAWRPASCPPPVEQEVGSSLVSVTGPCAFEHHGAVNCEVTPDDFLVTMSRKGALGSTVMIFINVEKYAGPGRYEGGQMFVGVQDKTNIYRWSSDTVTATVGPGEVSLILPETRVEAEPLLVKCSGPMTNYQCEGRDEATAIEGTVEVVAGTFQCDKGGAPQ